MFIQKFFRNTFRKLFSRFKNIYKSFTGIYFRTPSINSTNTKDQTVSILGNFLYGFHSDLPQRFRVPSNIALGICSEISDVSTEKFFRYSFTSISRGFCAKISQRILSENFLLNLFFTFLPKFSNDSFGKPSTESFRNSCILLGFLEDIHLHNLQ